MSTRRIIISRHVIFDESVFPFSAAPSAASMPSSLDFLMQGLSSSPTPASTTLPLTATSEDPFPALLDPAVLQLGPLATPAGGHTPAAPPAGGPQLGGQRFGAVYTRRARTPAAPATEPVAPAAASVAPAAVPPAAAAPVAPLATLPAVPVAWPMTHS